MVYTIGYSPTGDHRSNAMLTRFGDSRLPERFWEKCEPEPNSGCWLWTAGCSKGYGVYRIGEKTGQAYSHSYKTLIGPVPEGLELDHLCRTPCCVNPAHLEPVTHGVNLLRGNTINAKNATKTHCKRGHNNWRIRKTGRYCRTCGTENMRKYQETARRGEEGVRLGVPF